MEASIREPNIKHFVRLLQCASRYGDELCMHANKDLWELSVTNSSKSAYCLFRLEPSFFSRFKAVGNAAQQRRGVKCQLYVKSVLGVLGKASSVNAVERIDLRIVDPEGGLRARTQRNEEEDDDIYVSQMSSQLELKLLYRHGITKKHFLHLQSSDFLRAVVDPKSTPSGFTIAAKLLRDWLDHFSIAFSGSSTSFGGGGGSGATVKSDSQLGWMFSLNEVRVKNFEGGNASALSTELRVDIAEFENYTIVNEGARVDFALPMKEFKASLQLAEQFNMNLDICFSEATQPLTMSSMYIGPDRNRNNVELFSIFCAIATTLCDAFPSPPPSVPPNPSTNGGIGHENGNRRSASSITSNSNDHVGQARRNSQTARAGSIRPAIAFSTTDESRVGPSVSDESRISHPKPEPLFQPGGSQSLSQTTRVSRNPASQSIGVRLSQAEAFELAGFQETDIEALLEDADEDEDMDLGGANEGDVPDDFDDIDWENMQPAQMSTQVQDIAARQGRNNLPQSQTRSQLNAPSFLPDQDIYDVSEDSARLGTSNSHVLRERVQEEEEIDEDSIDPTQPTGRRFEQLLDD